MILDAVGENLTRSKLCGSGIRPLFDPWFLDPGLQENPGPGSGMNIPIIFLELSTILPIFWVKNTSVLDADPDAGSGIFSVLDPRSGIQDKHPGSVTLTVYSYYEKKILRWGREVDDRKFGHLRIMD